MQYQTSIAQLCYYRVIVLVVNRERILKKKKKRKERRIKVLRCFPVVDNENEQTNTRMNK